MVYTSTLSNKCKKIKIQIKMQIPHSTRIPLKVKFDNLQIVVDQVNTCGCYRHFKLLLKLLLFKLLLNYYSFSCHAWRNRTSLWLKGTMSKEVWARVVESLLFRTTLSTLRVFVSLDWQPLPLLPDAAPSAPPEPFP